MVGRDSPALSYLDPLPVSVLTPVLLRLIDMHKETGHYDWNLNEVGETLITELRDYTLNSVLISSSNMYAVAQKMQDLLKKNWKPIDKSRRPLFNYQTGAVLWDALSDYWRAGRSS